MANKSWTDRELLELFVRRTQELYDRRIWKEGGLSFKINIDPEGTSFQQPDEELFRSYVMTFRLFVQEKEPTFFGKARNLAARHLKTELENEHTKLRTLKSRWEHALERSEFMVGIVGEDLVKPKVVLDTFLNGEYFHSDKDHRQLLGNYMSSYLPLERSLLIHTIASLSNIILVLGNFIGFGLTNNWFNLPNNETSGS